MMHKYVSFPRFDLDAESARRMAFAFTLFLLIFETYVVRVNYSDDFTALFNSESVLLLIVALVLVTGSLYLVYRFFYVAFSSDWPYRVVYFFVLAASLAVEYSYQKALGRFTQTVDIEFAAATTFEQKTASIAMYFGFAALIPILLFLILLIFTRGRRDEGFRELLSINVLIILGLLAVSVMSLSQFPTVSTIAFYRTNVEFAFFGPVIQGEWGSSFTGIKRQRNSIPAPNLPAGFLPDNNIVFVIDESARGDHFSLNGYGRPTTPFLDDLLKKGTLHNWGIAAAASTGSHTSYNTIITGLTPDDFPDPGHQKLFTTATIFQHAKAMGYTTWFLDGQMSNFWGGIQDDRRSIDHWFNVDTIKDPKELGDWNIDIAIAKRVNRIVSDSKGNFVFVFKHGLHVPYNSNFPVERTVWQPSYTNSNQFDIPSSDQLDAVANAYDNSILYNVNSFFENLINDYERIPNNTVIVYTGDHGQTLFANGKASHNGHTREESTVPLLIIGDLKTGVDTNYKASHFNLYPTILDLIDYPMDLRGKSSALSLLKAKSTDSRPRFFNPAYGNKVAFD
jgi:glucan phosphoethanolaminetransferase (alkaline phosphatase superfamily)